MTIPIYLKAAPGECALDFLNIPVGALGASLGQGGLARIDGPQSIFSNPAHLGDRTGAFASYQKLLMDTRSEAFGLGIALDERYSLGFGIHVFEPGNIDGYSGENERIGNIKSGDYLLRLGLSSRGVLSYGVAISYYSQKLDDLVGTGAGISFGLSREFSLGRLALTADNIGPDFKIGNSSAPLPQKYSVSAWIPLSANYVDLVCDLSYRRNVGMRVSGGVVYSPIMGFSVRAGSSRDIPFSAGIGLTRGDIEIDYSFLPSRVFGDRHIFSFSLAK